MSTHESARADALLSAMEYSNADERNAALILAGHASGAGELREWLEMCGLMSYPSGAQDGVKTCKKCGDPKPLVAFPRNRQTIDGYSLHCHQCKNGDTQ